MTAPEYLDPVRHELHQLRAKVARAEALAGRWERKTGRASHFLYAPKAIAALRLALSDKEPTP